MALRIRKDGRILCAALHPKESDDIYIDDGLHYRLSELNRVFVTEPEPKHSKRGEWWFSNQVPDGIEIEHV